MSKRAKLRLSWSLSVSNDVVSQRLVIFENGSEIVNSTLDKVTSEYFFVTNESAIVGVELKAYDGTYYSDPAIASFTVGDLTKPQPPTGLTIYIDEVIDEETDENV